MSESVIHDIGYQRYTGPRLGRGYAMRSLFVHGLRTAFGLGRSAKAKIFPWIIIGLVGAIGLIFAVAKAQGATISYLELPPVASILILIFLAVVAPELLSRDLRNSLLPLYFSRPLRRTDYVFAKLGAAMVAAWLLLAGPQTLIFAAGAFGGGDVWDEFTDLLRGYTMSGIYAVIFATIAMLIASIASRRAFAAGAIAAVFMVSLPIAGIVMSLGSATAQALGTLLSPMLLPEGIRWWLFGSGDADEIHGYGPLHGLVGLLLPTVCVLLLLLRYRKVSL